MLSNAEMMIDVPVSGQPGDQPVGGEVADLMLENETSMVTPDIDPMTGMPMAATGPRKSARSVVTPAQSRRESFGTGESMVTSSGKRRGRPKGWTDARIHGILNHLERNMQAYKTTSHTEFYSSLCVALGYDLSEAAEIMDKCEKMVKKYESDTRRGDGSWKWYGRLNQVFGGPALPPFGRVQDDDAASSSLDSLDEEASLDEDGQPKRRVRGENHYEDRVEHEKLLLKLKKLKSKTEMRHREWEAAAQKQAQAFEDLKAKTALSIARLEKAILNAGYLLDQADILADEQHHMPIHQ